MQKHRRKAYFKADSRSLVFLFQSPFSQKNRFDLAHTQVTGDFRKVSLAMRGSVASWILLIFASFLLRREVSAKIDGNPANEIMTVINNNRTSIKLPKLHDNSGLGCMALQYIGECSSNCTSNNTLTCSPPEVDITEVYAANCGVELPTVDNVTNHLITCSWNYLSPEEAFSKILSSDKKVGSIIHSKENVEAGVGFNKAGRHGPYFWCIFFSSGKGNSTFELEGGKGLEQKTGCFSGGGLTCNSGFQGPVLKLLFVMTTIFSCSVVLLLM